MLLSSLSIAVACSRRSWACALRGPAQLECRLARLSQGDTQCLGNIFRDVSLDFYRIPWRSS